MTMKLIAVSLTLKLLLSCPPFLVCPPSLSWTARSRLLILSMRPLICPWSIPCHFLIRMRRKPLESGVRLYGLVHFLLLQKSPSDGHSLAGRPHFPELGSDSTIYWPSLVTFLPRIDVPASIKPTIRPLSCLVVWAIFPVILEHLSLLTIVACLPSLTPLFTDNYCWCSSQPIYPKRDQKKTFIKGGQKKRRSYSSQYKRFSLNRGFCNFWNSTLSHSSARKSTKQHRSATQDVSKCAEINGE